MKDEIRKMNMDTIIPSSQFSPSNLKAEEQMIRRHKALRILPTECMAQRQRELNKSVDQLTERGLWDSEHRRQHDALAKKKRIAQAGTGLCILLAIAMQIALGALAAKSFDSTGETSFAPTTQQLTQTENRTCR